MAERARAAPPPAAAPAEPAPGSSPFAIGDYTGQASAAFRPGDLERELARLVDPAAAQQTLHWGRNYLYVTRCETAAGPLAVVVKQFRHRHLRDRLRRRMSGSKALKSWRIAQALCARGIATPEPLLLAESRRPDGPSFYVCRYLEGSLEARYLLRAANAGTHAEQFPDIDLADFLERLGSFIRHLHDAGFWHRDLSSGNILLVRPPGAPAGSPRQLWLVDLNRARAGRRLGLYERVRDLSRMNLLRREHQALFLAGYWRAEGGPPALGRALYRAAFNAFLWKNQLKKWVRGARPAGGSGLVRVPHAHIPDAPAGAAARDRAVWDRLSDQPHQHAGGLAKLRVRLADAPGHLAAAAAVARALPRVLRRYRQLPRALYGGPVAWDGAGVCLRPWPEAPEALVALVERLGTRHVLLRLHPWEEDHDDEEALAAELHARGYQLTFALPQNRALVRDPARWRAALACLGERFTRYGPRFQIGQAINRSKWGVWNLGEYLELARGAEQVLRQGHPEVQLLGPSVIDFEYHVAIAALNARGAGFHFDAVSALLYVDRRGGPESRQAGFDTVDKVRLLRAIADTARHAAGRCWITEVNWPLWEGPHSPAGRKVAVSEEVQADYLVRYFLLTLATGLVERVFWWQLAARGYGLVDPADPRRPRCRPSFAAFSAMQAELAGSRCEEVLPVVGEAAAAGARLYRFRRPAGGDVVVGWSSMRGARVTLPRPAVRVAGRDGQAVAAPGCREVEVGPSPAYFHLAE